ncbi:MAG TPA: LysR family transcriptional regulator [Chthoniobacterales bacterium]|nr:LysR family transcriptional regulator [Chthoniobacterales bacterium]
MRFAHILGTVMAQLRAFLVTLEEGSLNRAAVRLRMSQSTLSRQMQALEAEIGGALLERTTAGVRPTDAGYALVSSLPDVLAKYDAAIAEARRLARGQRDLIRVGYLGSAAQKFLDPALFAMRRSHPGVKVKLLDLSPGEQIVALRKAEIDLALIGQEGALLSTEFYTRKLTTLPVVAVMTADHPLASRKQIWLKELRGERFISSPEEDLPGRDRWIAQLCRRAGFRPKFVQAAASVSNMFTLIGSEGAVTLVPAYLKSFPVAGVAMVQLSDTKATWDFLVVWQRGRTAKSLRALLDALGASASSFEPRIDTN